MRDLPSNLGLGKLAAGCLRLTRKPLLALSSACALLAALSATPTFAQTADLAVSKAGAPLTVGTGANITYTLSVTNAGPNDGSAVTLTDVLPPGVTFVSGSAGCTELLGVVTCVVGPLVANTSAGATIVVTATSCGAQLTNVVSVAAAEIDPNLLDNTNSAVNAVMDMTAPVIGACPANITGTTDAGLCTKAGVTWVDPTATDNCTASPAVVCSPASGSTFNKGATIVTCTATDAVGLTNACTFTVTINDTEAPVIGACPANITGNTDSGTCTKAGVTWTVPSATDNCPGVLVACSPASGTTFAKGVTTVTCTATDAVGLTSACTFTVTISDAQAPTIVCPANVTTNLTAGCTTPVTFTNPVVSDNCPGSTFVCVPANGSTFSLGTTTVTCTPTDASLNVGAVCTFTVTVTAAAPTISAQPQPQATPMGNGAVFSVTAAGTSTLTYQWRSNGVNIAGATASSLAISNLNLASSGNFDVVINNCAGSLTSAAASLTVTPISAISFDFNTPGQYTNAPYNLVGNDWHNNAIVNSQPFGPIVPFEVSTGGVGVAVGGGALDLLFNNGTDQSSTFTPLSYDFSLPGKVITASIMTKIKVPTAVQRAIQIGFITQTNGADALGKLTTAGVNATANLGWMSAIFQSTVVNVVNPSYQLRAQYKVIAGTTAIETIPINSPTNVLTTNRWYKFVAKFTNVKAAGNSSSNYTVESTIQDMGDDGITPGAVVLAMPALLQTNVDIVNQRNLYLSIRGLENGGNDYWDNIYVTTASGNVAFVQQPANQTVRQGRMVTFRALVDGDGPYTYQWFKNGSPIAGAGNWKYTTPQLLLSDDQAQYTVSVTSPNNTITSSAAVVTVQADALDVLSVGSVEGSVIGLRFDQPVTKATAENPANYLINGTPAYSAQLLVGNGIQQYRTNGTEVLLTPAAPITGNFTVTVANVVSISGNAVGANNSASGTVVGLTPFDVDPLSIGLNGDAPRAANGQNATLPGTTLSFAPGQFTTIAGGHDIFGNFDGFHFTYKLMTGDFDLKMRVPYIDLVRTPTKAGFNARISLDPSSPNVGAYVNPALPGRGFSEGGSRLNYGGVSVSWGQNATNYYPDAWLRFRRVGNTFIRYSSTNGVNWGMDGQTSLTPNGQNMPETLYVGLAMNCNVGTGTIQQYATSQVDGYGNFAGYPGASIAINTQPVDVSVAAGASASVTVVATATGGGIPNRGEVTYLWQRTNSAAGGWTNMPTAGATNNILSTGALVFTDNGAKYRAIISAPGAASVTSAVATVTVTDTAGPTLTAGGTLVPTNSPNQILVTFSEFVSAGTALNSANYVLTNAAGTVFSIANVSFLSGSDRRVVVITTTSPLPQGNYGVRITGVQDLNGNNITAGTTGIFTQVASGQQAGPVVIDYYGTLAAAGNIGDLLTNVKYVNNTPDWITYSNIFGVNGGAATFPTSAMGDNYGCRMYSYFIPTNTGQYTFWWKADDFAQFYMNTNATDSTNPVGKTAGPVLAANNPNYLAANTFITAQLNVGQPYYVELNFKETGGGDGGALMVTAGNSVATVPVNTTVAPGTLFAFPDAVAPRPKALVELYTGLANNTPPNGNGSISDLLFVTNIQKIIIGQPDTIAYERYFGYSTNLGNTSLDNYLGRIISYFVPPSNGLYRFLIRSDDSSQLFMNTNANPATSTDPNGKVLLGQLNAFTAAYTLVAQNISLVGGQSYYMEGRWREGGGGDGMTVAVRAQADASAVPTTEVILGDMLRFPTNLDRVGPVNFNQAGSGPSLTPVTATVKDGDTLTLYPRGLAGSPPYSFQWYKNGQLIFANNPYLVTLPLTVADNGAVYTLLVSNLFSSAVSSSCTVTVLADSTPPTIVSAVASQYGDTVLVTFSENLDPLTAQCLANYRIPGLTIYSVGFDPINRKRVSLKTSPQAMNTGYTVQVSGVRDGSSSGNMIAANSMMNFSSWGFGGIGGVYVEYFTNIPNTSVDFFLTDPKGVYNMPDIAYYTNTFSGGPFGAESGLNEYCLRVSGLFMPPSNGLYRFFIRGDDGTRLFMNTNGPSPAGRTLIARNDGANSGSFAAFTGWQSGTALGRVGASISPILSLTNNTPYYLEALLKEGGGGDHLEVFMAAIDALTLTEIGGVPVPAAGQAIGGGFFSAPGNPDLNKLLVITPPPASLMVTESDPITLSLIASILPSSLQPFAQYQWQRSNALSGGAFVTIPGATGPSYSFFAAMTDDNGAYRVLAGIPGTNVSFTTFMSVVPDNVPPFIESAGSVDGWSISIRFNELVDTNNAGDNFAYTINGDTLIGITAIELQPGGRAADGRSFRLLLGSQLTGPYTVEAYGMVDRSVMMNSGDSQVSGQVEGYAALDVGGPTQVGSSLSFSSNTVDVVAGGADIWTAADSGHLTLKQRTGDFDVRARVARLTRSAADVIAKAGLMVREDLNANSRTLHQLVNPSASIGGRDIYENGRRETPGNLTGSWNLGTQNGNNGVPAGVPNAWVRIKRTGNLFTAYRSADGMVWLETATNTLTFSNTVYVGFASTAHNNAGPAVSADYRDIYIPNPPSITLQPTPGVQTVNVHAPVSYTVAANNPANSGTLTYQWKVNGINIPGATSATLNIADASKAHEGAITCWVGNDGGQTISDAVVLNVNNPLPVAGNDTLIATQGITSTVSSAALLANDTDADPVGLYTVSGMAPVTIATDFSTSPLAGAAIYGNSAYDGANGILSLNGGGASQAGSLVITNPNPTKRVAAFTASFKVRISDTSAEPADGFSFNFANDIPDAATGARAAEDGVGSGFSFCIDNYRFASYPAGGTANTSGMKVRYNNVDVAGIQIPSWGYGAFIPVTITVTPTGGCTITVNNTNAFTLALPGYTPALGRFGIFARTGGSFESHAIDDLSIAFVTLDTAAGGQVSESGGVVTYVPPVTCGLDSFYYVATDGQLNGLSVARVDVNVRTLTPTAPSITTCATNRYIIITNGTAVLPNLTGEVVATDDCGNVVITQSPLAGTVIGPGPTVVTLTATDTDGLTATCMATVSVYNVSPNVTSPSYGPGGFMGTFPTAPGITYIVEYTDQLVEPTSVWTTLTTIVGDGTDKTFTDAGPLPAYRYYRVRTQ